MTKTEGAGPTADPFEVWRQLYDTNERTWSANGCSPHGSGRWRPTWGSSGQSCLE